MTRAAENDDENGRRRRRAREMAGVWMTYGGSDLSKAGKGQAEGVFYSGRDGARKRKGGGSSRRLRALCTVLSLVSSEGNGVGG